MWTLPYPRYQCFSDTEINCVEKAYNFQSGSGCAFSRQLVLGLSSLFLGWCRRFGFHVIERGVLKKLIH